MVWRVGAALGGASGADSLACPPLAGRTPALAEAAELAPSDAPEGDEPAAHALQAVMAGAGPPLVLLHAFALDPPAYQGAIDRLAPAHRVVAPWWLRVADGTWTLDRALAGLHDLLDVVAPDGPVTLVGHSFGGALGLAFAARWPHRVAHLALADSLAVAPSRRDLARIAVPGRQYLALTSLPGASAFFRSVSRYPRNVGRAGWWGFTVRLDDSIREVVRARVPSTVLWAQEDSLLPVRWGAALARALGARFFPVPTPDGGRRVDHDWPFRHPALFVDTLTRVRVAAG